MPRLRHKHEKNFTVLSNSLLRDKRLSFKARGLGAYLYCLPEEWEFSVSGIVADGGKDGRDAVESAVHELEAAGYLVREKGRRELGQFSGGTWTISDEPTVGDFPDWGKHQQESKEIKKGQTSPTPSGRAHKKPGAGRGVDVEMDEAERTVLL